MIRTKILAVTLLALAAFSSHAMPITYDIEFTPNSGISATGVFTYDESVPDLLDLSVTWGAYVFDDFNFVDSNLCGGGAAGMFGLLSMNCTINNFFWNAGDFFGPTFSFSAAVGADEDAFYATGNSTNLSPTFSSGHSWSITPRTLAVSEVAILPLIAIGLIGLGFTRRRPKPRATG